MFVYLTKRDVDKQRCGIKGLSAKISKANNLLRVKYGCDTIYDVDLVAVNLTVAVKLMDCVTFVGIMDYPGELSASQAGALYQIKQPVNKDILALFKCFTRLIFS